MCGTGNQALISSGSASTPRPAQTRPLPALTARLAARGRTNKPVRRTTYCLVRDRHATAVEHDGGFFRVKGDKADSSRTQVARLENRQAFQLGAIGDDKVTHALVTLDAGIHGCVAGLAGHLKMVPGGGRQVKFGDVASVDQLLPAGKVRRRRGRVESEWIGRGGAGSQATGEQEGEQEFHRFHDGTHCGYRSAI
jgi:hypothetical protein